MDIISKYDEMIFKNEKDGKVSYSIGMAKKKEDGTWERGYFPVRFRKDVNLDTKTKIRIKSAWMDFFKLDKKTLPYIFINEFEKVEQVAEPQLKPIESPKSMIYDDDELPFY